MILPIGFKLSFRQISCQDKHNSEFRKFCLCNDYRTGSTRRTSQMTTKSASAIFPLTSLLRPVYAFPNMYCSCANIPLQKIARTKANLDRLLHVRISSSHDTTHSLLSLQSHTTRPLAGHRKPPIYTIPSTVQRPPPTNDPQQPTFHRLSKFLRFSRANTVPVRHIKPRNPLDVCRDSISWFFNG
jgi:hypothetical protein